MHTDIDALIRHYGFDIVGKMLHEKLKECAGFDLVKTGPCEIGKSKVGGFPDVPSNFNWPMHGNRRLAFVCQVNLEELSKLGTSIRLPSNGILSFFYDLEKQPWGYDPKDIGSCAIVHINEDCSRLVRTPVEGQGLTFDEYAMNVWQAITIPEFGSRGFAEVCEAYEAIAGGELDYERYAELCSDLYCLKSGFRGSTKHRIGGHSTNVQGDMQLEAALVTNGLYCGDQTGYKDPRAAVLRKDAHNWELILQLDSDEYYMWGDSGMIYFHVHCKDGVSDLTRPWLGLQCC
jgi:uncharacterized protein YwqG